jgi:hypothetical protein
MNGLVNAIRKIKKFDAGGDVAGFDMNNYMQPQRRGRGNYRAPAMNITSTPTQTIGGLGGQMRGIAAAQPARVAPLNQTQFGPSGLMNFGATPSVPTLPPPVPTPTPMPAPPPPPPATQVMGGPGDQPLPGTMAPVTANTGQTPYVSGLAQTQTGLDPLTKQLLFGLDGQGGFIPGAMQAAESTFFNADGTPRVVDQTISGFTEDQKTAMDAIRGSVGQTQPFYKEAGDLYRDTTGRFDRGQIDKFFNPFEDQVVQQAIKDVRDYGAREDISDTASAIRSGGLSAFGERAAKFAGEKAAGRERGLLEAVAGIRSGGFDRATSLAMTEQERRNQARRQAASGLLDLGGKTQQSTAFDIDQLLGSGGLQQTLAQRQAEAARQNAIARQMAPLQQFQSLAPFVSMAPAGTFQTTTQYGKQPSAMQTGLGVGLSALGSLGNFLNFGTT